MVIPIMGAAAMAKVQEEAREAALDKPSDFQWAIIFSKGLFDNPKPSRTFPSLASVVRELNQSPRIPPTSGAVVQIVFRERKLAGKRPVGDLFSWEVLETLRASDIEAFLRKRNVEPSIALRAQLLKRELAVQKPKRQPRPLKIKLFSRKRKRSL